MLFQFEALLKNILVLCWPQKFLEIMQRGGWVLQNIVGLAVFSASAMTDTVAAVQITSACVRGGLYTYILL